MKMHVSSCDLTTDKISQKGKTRSEQKKKPYSCYTKEAIDLKPPSLMWLARELSPVFTILPLSCKLQNQKHYQ
jgi:hypothetical protein